MTANKEKNIEHSRGAGAGGGSGGWWQVAVVTKHVTGLSKYRLTSRRGAGRKATEGRKEKGKVRHFRRSRQ